jgi:hypothetical protein
MKITEQIRTFLERTESGELFGYEQLGIAKKDYATAAKALERLQKQGVIRKASKGVFFKPEQTILGELSPNYDKYLERRLFKNGKRIGYITGSALYNSLNLTTQMTFSPSVAFTDRGSKIEKGWLRARPVKAYVAVTDENYQLLGILDALKDIKYIPDTRPDYALKILMSRMKKYEEETIKQLIAYALSYPPRVRALLGAMVENVFESKFDVEILRHSLNPLTKYKLTISKALLPNASTWNLL